MKEPAAYPTFRHGSLTVVAVQLTKEEVEEAFALGKKRTDLDEKTLGWKYRHHGMPSERAHAIGMMGEKAMEKWLESLKLKREVDFVPAKPFVLRKEEIRQDFTVFGRQVALKTAQCGNLAELTAFRTFLYPAKKEPGESKRVLGYPEYLIQAAVNPQTGECWLCGFVDRATITSAPVATIVGKPAHRIPTRAYRPVSQLLDQLKAQRPDS